MGLNVGGFCSEKFFHTLDGDGLDLVNELTAVVVTLAGISLGVLVGKHAALSGTDGAAGEVLAGDELDAVILTLCLFIDQICDFGVSGTDGGNIIIALDLQFLKAA